MPNGAIDAGVLDQLQNRVLELEAHLLPILLSGLCLAPLEGAFCPVARLQLLRLRC